MLIAHTDYLIEEIGIHLENRPKDHLLLAAHDTGDAVFIMEHVIPRVQWKRNLREGMIFQRSRYRVRFWSGAELQVISAQGHRMRGMRVDAVFVEDRVWDLPSALNILESLAQCERR